MARQLKTIARWINENVPELRAVISEGYYNTDRKVGRLRWPGKGRTGTHLTVYNGQEVVLEHDNADPCRRNSEVEEWLTRWVAGQCTSTFCMYGNRHDARCRLAGKKKS